MVVLGSWDAEYDPQLVQEAGALKKDGHGIGHKERYLRNLPDQLMLKQTSHL